MALVRHGALRRLPAVVVLLPLLVVGALGLVAGHRAASQAEDSHRQDRVALQRTLGGLTGQYALVLAGSLQTSLASQVAGGELTWPAVAGDRGVAERLREVTRLAASFDVGAVLVGPLGQRLGSYGADRLPSPDDPAWDALRAAVLAGRLPLSGVLTTGAHPSIAVGLPVALADHTTGLVVGLARADTSALERYVTGLAYLRTGHGYVLDASGAVLAGPDPAQVGHLLPDREARARLLAAAGRRDAGLLRSGDLEASYARAGTTGWTGVTLQSHREFLGPLVRSGRLTELAIAGLLVLSTAGLLALQRARVEAMRRVALHDELTGLYNRRGWFTVAGHELERAGRSGTPRTLLFVDLDGLKQVNDVLGHRQGDRAIADAADVLRAATRASDVVGRLGGDEFVLLLGEGGTPEIARTRLTESLREHNERSAAGFELRLSMGAELWLPGDACSLEELVRRADAVMYVDKLARPARGDGVLRLPLPRGATAGPAARPGRPPAARAAEPARSDARP